MDLKIQRKNAGGLDRSIFANAFLECIGLHMDVRVYPASVVKENGLLTFAALYAM
jgi:hypothetical protein